MVSDHPSHLYTHTTSLLRVPPSSPPQGLSLMGASKAERRTTVHSRTWDGGGGGAGGRGGATCEMTNRSQQVAGFCVSQRQLYCRCQVESLYGEMVGCRSSSRLLCFSPPTSTPVSLPPRQGRCQGETTESPQGIVCAAHTRLLGGESY